jgi:hypothetical protein
MDPRMTNNYVLVRMLSAPQAMGDCPRTAYGRIMSRQWVYGQGISRAGGWGTAFLDGGWSMHCGKETLRPLVSSTTATSFFGGAETEADRHPHTHRHSHTYLMRSHSNPPPNTTAPNFEKPTIMATKYQVGHFLVRIPLFQWSRFNTIEPRAASWYHTCTKDIS